MILVAGLVVAVLGGGYFAVKHYGSAAVLTAVKAEIAKAEAALPGMEASVKAEVAKVVAAIKAKL